MHCGQVGSILSRKAFVRLVDQLSPTFVRHVAVEPNACSNSRRHRSANRALYG